MSFIPLYGSGFSVLRKQPSVSFSFQVTVGDNLIQFSITMFHRLPDAGSLLPLNPTCPYSQSQISIFLRTQCHYPCLQLIQYLSAFWLETREANLLIKTEKEFVKTCQVNPIIFGMVRDVGFEAAQPENTYKQYWEPCLRICSTAAVVGRQWCYLYYRHQAFDSRNCACCFLKPIFLFLF